MTVADLLNAAAFNLGLLQSGEVLTADDQSVAFLRLNDWVDDLKTQGLSVFSVARATWTIIANQASYTVGLTGQVAIDRPMAPQDIQNIGYLNNAFSPAVEVLIGPVLTEDQYAAIPIKAFSNPLPSNFYYAPTYGSSQLGTLFPWPVPSSSTLQGVIYAPALVEEFATVNDTIFLPPGYRRFLRSNLAVEMAPDFDTEPNPALMQAATESRANVKRKNERLTDMGSDVSKLFNHDGRANFYTGQE